MKSILFLIVPLVFLTLTTLTLTKVYFNQKHTKSKKYKLIKNHYVKLNWNYVNSDINLGITTLKSLGIRGLNPTAKNILTGTLNEKPICYFELQWRTVRPRSLHVVMYEEPLLNLKQNMLIHTTCDSTKTYIFTEKELNLNQFKEMLKTLDAAQIEKEHSKKILEK